LSQLVTYLAHLDPSVMRLPDVAEAKLLLLGALGIAACDLDFEIVVGHPHEHQS
jgi:hypothetical protein